MKALRQKKSRNKQWPQNNIELKDQSVKISLRLLNARGYSVEVTHGAHNEILYVVGTREGLERYRSLEDLGEVDKNQDIVIRECINVLQEYDNTEILYEHLLRLSSSQNSQVALYLDNKFKLRDSRKLKPILEILLEHPSIEQARDSPITLRWLRGGKLGNGNNEDKDNDTNDDDNNKDEDSKTGLSPKDTCSKVSPMEHSSIHSVAKTASVCGNEEKFLEQLQNNFQPQTKNNSCQNKFSTPRPWGTYWICKKQRGKLSKIMEDLLKRKEEYKATGLTLKEKSIKLLMNSGYGTFGQAYFKYYDPRVAELITGFARYTLDSLVKFVNENGGKILFGDTDSIFVAGDNKDTNNSRIDIVSEAKEKYNIKLVQDRLWKVLFLTSNKKQYVGLTEQGKIIDKGLVGKKNNQPAYFNEVISYLISKEYLEQFIDEGVKVTLGRIEEYVRFVYQTLDQKLRDHDLDFIVDKLAYSNKSSNALYDIKQDGWQKDIYNEICADNGGNIELAKSKSQANCVYKYWKVSDPKGKSGVKVTMHPESHMLNIHKYKEESWTCIKPLLEVYGLAENELTTFENEIVK